MCVIIFIVIKSLCTAQSMNLVHNKFSFILVSHPKREKSFDVSSLPQDFLLSEETPLASHVEYENDPNVRDVNKRLFLKLLGGAGLGIFASTLFPKKSDALVLGNTPTSNVVGVRNVANAKINPATEESLQTLLKGQGVLKGTTTLTSSGTVKTPTSGKKLRVYATRFSLSADMTSVSFRFTSGGTDYELYVSPKTGGLYGANNHPNYVEGGINEVLYCAISGTGTVQINFDYLEV